MSADKKATAAERVIQLDILKTQQRQPPVPPDDEGPSVSHQPSLGNSVSHLLTPRRADQPATAREKSGTFTNLSAYQDVPPSRRNNRARTDVAMGPSRTAASKEQTSRLDKKWGLVGDMPFQDLLWICEQSFRKEAATLAKEILAIARNEFTNVTDSLLHDIRQPVETLADEIVPKITKTLQEVEAPAKVNWDPMHLDLHGQGQRLDGLEQQVTEELSLLRSELRAFQQQHKDASSGLGSQMDSIKGELSVLQGEVVKRSERQATQVLNVQQSLCAETALVTHGVKELHEEMRSTHDQLFPRMETQLKRFVQDEPVNVNFSDVIDHFGKETQAILRNQADLIGTMNAIKMELQDEFSVKIEEQSKAVRVRFEEMAHATTEAASHQLRDSWTQTKSPPVTDRSAQTEGKVLIPKKLGGRSNVERMVSGSFGSDRETEDRKKEKEAKPIFADGEAMRKRARQALIKPQYDVTNFYKDSGWSQAIAKHWSFEYLTYLAIFANAIWIAVDIDNNDANLLVHAEPQFQIVEHIFCAYFTGELLIRFAAFKHKWNCIRDAWFVFDLFLVSAMIVETWLITIVFLAAGLESSPNVGQLSGLRMFRMVKMIRLSRMAKLLQAIPEILVLLKAIGAALRSMMIFFLLWLVVIYIFAVIFRQFTEGGSLEQSHFQSVPSAMNTLLLHGILPENRPILSAVMEDNPIYYPLMMCFILLTSITLMYMLIGVLTEVIHLVASTEKEGMLVSMVASRLRAAFQTMGRREDEPLSKLDFQEVLVQPEVATLCQEVGVNVVVLVDMSDVIFESIDKEGKGMNFENLVEVVLNMRGTNPATVKDVKEQLRVIKSLVNDSHAGMLSKISRGFDSLSREMQVIRGMVSGDDIM